MMHKQDADEDGDDDDDDDDDDDSDDEAPNVECNVMTIQFTTMTSIIARTSLQDLVYLMV